MNERRERPPLLLVVDFVLQLIRLLGVVTLTLYAYLVVAFLLKHPGAVIGAESRALKLISDWVLSWK